MNKFLLTFAIASTVLGSAAFAQTNAPAGSTDRGAPTVQRSGNEVAIIQVDVARVVNPQDKVTYAILSVGGFLGIGSKLVAVPFESLKTVKEERLMLPGATKDALKTLPEFKYAKS
jgi:hypothetical protein